jgi:hypothetical protein
VTVTGAVDFPGFQKYDLFLKSGETMIFVATVFSPVINGNLAFLDTRTFPDGTYQLVVRAVRTDSNYTDHLGPMFTIENNLGAPLPHAEVPASPLYPSPVGAVARIQNCSGFNLEFDYTSPQGFCSSDDLWIMPKTQDMTLCTIVDVLLIAGCEYRGTAFSEDGQSSAMTYSFDAEFGKIYEIVYPGGEQLFINEIKGDERAETDTAGLDLDDPERVQTVEEIMASASEMMEEAEDEMAAAESGDMAEAAAPAAEVAPESMSEDAETATTEAPDAASESEGEMLPESGKAADPAAMPFVIAAGGLILFMVVGGVAAARRGKQSA